MGCSVVVVTIGAAAFAHMQAYLVDIAAKVVIRSETDPNELCDNLYAQITEFIHNDDDLLNLEIELLPLPGNCNGSPDRRDKPDSEEGSKAPVS
jgi:hypothetical protein